MGFFGEIWAIFLTKDVLDQVMIALSLTSFFLSLPFIQFLRSRSVRSQRDALRLQLGEQQTEIENLREDLNEASPSAWMAQYHQDIQKGMRSEPATRLSDSVVEMSAQFGKACELLVQHYTNDAILDEDAEASANVRQFASWCNALNPANSNVQSAIDQLNFIEAVEDTHPQFSEGAFPDDPVAAAHLVDLLEKTGKEKLWSGEYAAAIAISKRAVQIANSSGIVERPSSISANVNLAAATAYAGDDQGAIDLLELVIPTAENTLGANQSTTLYAKRILCDCYIFIDQPERAIKVADILLSNGVDWLGPDDYCHLLFVKIKSLSVIGRVDEAANHLRNLREIEAKVRRHDHPTALISRFFETRLLAATGQVDEAIEKINELIPDMVSVNGENHPNHLIAWRQKVLLLNRRGEHSLALEEARQLLPVYEEGLGKEHVQVRIARMHYFEARIGARDLDGLDQEISLEIDQPSGHGRPDLHLQILRLKARQQLSPDADLHVKACELLEAYEADEELLARNRLDYELDFGFLRKLSANPPA